MRHNVFGVIWIRFRRCIEVGNNENRYLQFAARISPYTSNTFSIPRHLFCARRLLVGDKQAQAYKRENPQETETKSAGDPTTKSYRCRSVYIRGRTQDRDFVLERRTHVYPEVGQSSSVCACLPLHGIFLSRNNPLKIRRQNLCNCLGVKSFAKTKSYTDNAERIFYFFVRTYGNRYCFKFFISNVYKTKSNFVFLKFIIIGQLHLMRCLVVSATRKIDHCELIKFGFYVRIIV